MSSSPSSTATSSGGEKWTVREMKRRTKKSRTLPSRLKFLSGSKSTSVSSDNIPATIQTTGSERIVVTKSTLSIFRGRDDPWNFDLDDTRFDSSLEYSYPPPPYLPQMSKSCVIHYPSPGGSGRNSIRETTERSKSLTRSEGDQNSKLIKNLNRGKSGSVSFGQQTTLSSPMPIRKTTRNHSRIKLNNSTFSMCFATPAGDGEEGDLEIYTERDMTRSRPLTPKLNSTSLFINDLDDEKFYPSDTSYDKACGNERRNSTPLTPLLGGRDTPSRFANFFSKRSFKSNPLKRTKSVTKLERKKITGMESESSIVSSRLRTSRSHESLLTWTNNSLQNFVTAGMMSTLDLAAGDVTVRPMHPSILGQDFGFELTTQSGGSKYYSCSSLAERDALVRGFRQTIKPYSDEIRRLENSLKLWILEGKGLGTGKQSTSKRYFCELYLDETLYARTSSKSKGEMLFWGEHFEFTQLPNCIQLITVKFLREGDKKRKKDKNTCLGKVKIPVSSVTSRYLIEKWYQVTTESTSPSAKDKEKDPKDGPSIRIKCKFQSVDILPLRCYKPFLAYVKDEYGPVCESLENVLSVKAKEDLASAMVHVLHHENLAKEFIAELALQELLKSGDEKLTFRGNSIATKAMEAFLKLTGSEYLHETLGAFIEDFQNSEDIFDCEIDPMKLQSPTMLSKNQENLRTAVEKVWKSILNSESNFPMELRNCFGHCRQALKSAGRDELGDHLISASIFLRFLCPAILSPSLFNITNEYPTEKSARNLTLVAKVLQTLANFTRFQGKEAYMEYLNDFVEKEAVNMKNFLAVISSPLEEEWNESSDNRRTGESQKEKAWGDGGFIDLGKYLSILSTLLSESVMKIAPKNERFKKLQELLETIHSLLKQPHNATNAAVFPFPHLTPPPLASPPPLLGIPGKSPNTPPISEQNGIPNQYYSSGHSPSSPISSSVYAVTNVNPNVKNISQVQLMNGMGVVGLPLPLHLQIPAAGIHHPSTHVLLHNQRSGSQASSGYQSQSPVLDGDKSKNSSPQISSGGNSSLETDGGIPRAERKNNSGSIVREVTPLSFSNPGFNSRKSGTQSVDDLSTIGLDTVNGVAGLPKGNEFKKRLTRSSSSSDYEYTSSIASTKANKNRASKPGTKKGSKTNLLNNNRLSRRSSAELLRKNHPYSSSSDDDSDSGLVNDKEMDPVPQLPPRRSHATKGLKFVLQRDSVALGDKSLEEVRHMSPRDSFGINPFEYEREMVELRRAMEALQVKLNRAEERLFGHEHSPRNRESDGSNSHSPLLSQYVQKSASEPGSKRNSQLGEKEMETLLRAEEEMKREQELLLALDRKQKLIEAQEQKISRLDAVNNQLLSALSQIRDSLQQQHVQQQQMKIQEQLLKQQQHLQSLSNSLAIPGHEPINYRSSTHFRATTNYLNNNGMSDEDHVMPQIPSRLLPSPRYSLSSSSQPNRSCNNNTTKILITSDHHSTGSSSGSVSPDSLDNHHQHHRSSNRDSSAIIGEQALQMLAELKSSSC